MRSAVLRLPRAATPECASWRFPPHWLPSARGGKSARTQFVLWRKSSASRAARGKGSGVPGLGRQHAQIDADLLEGFLVLAVGVLAEDQLGIGRAMQPSVLVDLVFELARRPAGIAERQYRLLRTVAARNRLEDIERGGEADAFVDRQRRVLDEEVAGVQDEAAAGLDRSALEHGHAAGARWQLDRVVSVDDIKLHQEILEIDVRGWLID